MPFATWCRLHAADAAARLELVEQRLQRRRLLREHRAAVADRLRRAWLVIEGGSPYRSREVH
jgi:hypothetical protein